MAKVVIMGAGIGGVSLAYEIRAEIGKEHEVLVVSDSPEFQFVPSNPWVAVDWRKRKDVVVEMEPHFKRKGIGFSAAGVKRVHPAENRLDLNDGSSVDYDYLAISTGPRLAFDEIPGLGPDGFTRSICHVDHAMTAQDDWKEFTQNPGPMVIGAAQMASCFGPAQTQIA